MLPGILWLKLISDLFIFSNLNIHQSPGQSGYVLIGDFQSEIGCIADWDASCEKTGFIKMGTEYRLNVQLPAGSWAFRLSDGQKSFGRDGLVRGPSWNLRAALPATWLFIYHEEGQRLEFRPVSDRLTARAAANPSLSLSDTLIYDPGGNMVANPGDSILYTMILRNETGQSVLNAILARSNDPNLSFDPASLKASPLAFRDTFQYSSHPLVIPVPGVLANDFDLNDVLPNPPFYANLWIQRVESNPANVGNALTTVAGGMITLNMDGSLTYDSTGINGAALDSITYTIKDADGFEDSSTIYVFFNQPPLLSIDPPDTICAFEQMDTFVATTVGLMDDGMTAAGTSVTICENYIPAEDTLVPGALPMGISSSWNDLTGSLSLTGLASLSDYESAIESIQYLNSSQNPSSLIRRICITVNDGYSNSNLVTKWIKVLGVNDCPLTARDTFLVVENGPFPASNVLTNDGDPDGDILSAIPDNQAVQGGMISIAMDGSVSYTQNPFVDSLSQGQVHFMRMQYTAADAGCMVNDSLVIRLTGINDPPVANQDSFLTDQLTKLTVAAPGILSDDEDIDQGAVLSVGRVNGMAGLVNNATLLSSGALLMVNGDGSFMYTPGCAGVMVDTFQYQAVDEHGALSDTVTVVIELNQRLWFVQEGAVPGTVGSFSAPFDQLADAEAASVAGDYIFVYPGIYNESLILKNDQKLIGAAVDWYCPPSNALLRNASGISRINGTITLAANDTVRGITMGEPSMAASYSFRNAPMASVGNLYICDTKINQNTSGGGISISSGGMLEICLDSLNVSGGLNALLLESCQGQIEINNGYISGMTSTAIGISSGSVNISCYNFNILHNSFPTAVMDISAGHAGLIQFVSGSLSASLGSGLQFSNADGTYDFNSGYTVTLNGGDAAIDILNGSDGRFLFGNTTQITNPISELIKVDNSTATLIYSGTFTKNNSNTGITINNNGGDTILFDGTGSKTISTGSSTAINLTSNPGTIMSFTGGNLDIDCTTGTGMNVSGGGTLTVTGVNNTINCSMGGHALKMLNTNIGSGNLNFDYIASTGGTSTGILLSNSGTSGGLMVSRGSITGKTGSDADSTQGIGIFISQCKGVVLDSVTLSTFSNFGILGYNVENLTMTYVTVNSSSINGNSNDEGSVAFGSESSLRNGLSGTVTISNCLIEDGYENNFTLFNQSGTVSQLNINSSIFRDNANPTGNAGLLIFAQGTATIYSTISTCSFSGNYNLGAAVYNLGSGLVDVVFQTNCTFSNNFNQLFFLLNGSGDLNYDVLNCTLSNASLSSASSQLICALGSSSVFGTELSGTISGNTITNTNSPAGNGIQITGEGAGSITTNISNNPISSVGQTAIRIQGTSGSNRIYAQVLNNMITVSGIGDGLFVRSLDNTQICTKITGNTISGAVSPYYNIYAVKSSAGSVFNIDNLGATTSDVTVVQNYLDSPLNMVAPGTVSASINGLMSSCTVLTPSLTSQLNK